MHCSIPSPGIVSRPLVFIVVVSFVSFFMSIVFIFFVAPFFVVVIPLAGQVAYGKLGSTAGCSEIRGISPASCLVRASSAPTSAPPSVTSTPVVLVGLLLWRGAISSDVSWLSASVASSVIVVRSSSVSSSSAPIGISSYGQDLFHLFFSIFHIPSRCL